TLDPTKWYLAAGVLGGSTERLYLFDAVTRQLLGSATRTNAPLLTTCNATIGAWTGANSFASPQNSFVGTLDDVRLYNVALSKGEIAATPRAAPVGDTLIAFPFQQSSADNLVGPSDDRSDGNLDDSYGSSSASG